MVSKDGVSAVPGQIAMDRGGRTELHVRAQVIHLDTNQMKGLFDSLILYGLTPVLQKSQPPQGTPGSIATRSPTLSQNFMNLDQRKRS